LSFLRRGKMLDEYRNIVLVGGWWLSGLRSRYVCRYYQQRH